MNNIEFTNKEIEILIRALTLSYFQEESLDDFKLIDVLKNKLIDLPDFSIDTCEILKKAHSSRMIETKIGEKLFLGGGVNSVVAANNLHKRLNYAISILGGMQQNGGMGSEFSEEEDLQGKNELHEVIKDIACALNVDLKDIK